MDCDSGDDSHQYQVIKDGQWPVDGVVQVAIWRVTVTVAGKGVCVDDCAVVEAGSHTYIRLVVPDDILGRGGIGDILFYLTILGYHLDGSSFLREVKVDGIPVDPYAADPGK